MGRRRIGGLVAGGLLAGVLAAAFGGAQAPPARVTRDEVREAIAGELRARGLRTPAGWWLDGLTLPVAVPAQAGRRLQVAAVCRDDSAGKLRWRLECGSGRCLPFFAYSGERLSPEIAGSVAACAGGGTSPARKAARAILVRPGERATAVLRTGSLTMTVAVRCLDAGGVGDEVRVRGAGGRVLRGQLAASGLVEIAAQ